MQYYCPECGGINNSVLTPKFCQCCGEVFSFATKSEKSKEEVKKPVKKPIKKIPRYKELADDDDGEDTEFDPDSFQAPEKLSVKITIDPPKKTKIEDVLYTETDAKVQSAKDIKLREAIPVDARKKLDEFRNRLNTVSRHEVGGS